MNPSPGPAELAGFLDHHLTHLDGQTFPELLHRLRFARLCLDDALAQLPPAETARLDAAGLLGVYRQAAGWADDPQPGRPVGEWHEEAMRGWARCVPAPHRGRPGAGADALAYAVLSFAEACHHTDHCRTGVPMEYDPRGSANVVVEWCRRADPARRDQTNLTQWRRAREFWPDMRPVGV